jgi:6,7-dimethyl-8-ribityllumazine synthase
MFHESSDDITWPNLQGKGLRIGLVQARFNTAITQGLREACQTELITGPGALEGPRALQSLASLKAFDALIALGCIIRGETYHFELVANESGAGVTRVSLDHGLPIANAILTTENLAQAQARMIPKGRDAARVAVEMARLKTQKP